MRKLRWAGTDPTHVHWLGLDRDVRPGEVVDVDDPWLALALLDQGWEDAGTS